MTDTNPPAGKGAAALAEVSSAASFAAEKQRDQRRKDEGAQGCRGVNEVLEAHHDAVLRVARRALG